MAVVTRVALVLLVAGVLVAGAPQTGAAISTGPADPEPDTTVTRVQVHENGSARWTVRIRTRLATDADVAEYRAFQERFRNDTASYREAFARRMRGVVAEAASRLGRTMEVRDVTAATSIQEVPRRWGVVTYAFTWTNFAATPPNGEAVVVGDAFGSGFFIAANDTLTITGPDGYAVEAASPAPTSTADGRLTWVGRKDFGEGEPGVRFVPATTSTGGPGGDPNDGSGGDEGVQVGIIVGGLLLAGVLLAGASLARRRWRDGRSPVDGSSGASGATAGGEEPTDLLTDEDRVLKLLDERGGRVRQRDIAETFEWSDSKTSRVVSGMAEDDEVEKLRIGRENVVSRPEDDGD